ncbi:hypothetical protein Bca101_101847 [Brassica carinata]
MHRHHATRGALPAAGPYLRLSRFQGGQAICTDGRSAGSRLGISATAAHSYSSRPGSSTDGRVSAQLGTVTRLPVHPASPVLLTKNGPLGALDSVGWLNKAATPSYLFKNSFPSSSYPEGNFGGNQLLDGSISLSPLYPSMLTLEPFSEDQGRSVVHPRGILPISFLTPYGFTHPLTRTHVRLLGPCFKTGRMGSPQADALSTQMPRHAATALIRVGPRPDSIGGPDCSVPHPTGTHRRPHPLPPDNFKHSLTLFSKSFSSLPRAPRGATGSGHDGALTLSGAPFQGTWARSVAEDASPDYNSNAEDVRFSSWALPGLWVIKSFWTGTSDYMTRIKFTTACQDAPDVLSSDFGQPRAVTHGRSASVPYPREDGGTTICDTQADVPSARRLGAQLAFKDSMVHGILQFTPSIAFRHALHRCEPRYPLPRVVLDFTLQHYFRTNTASGLAKADCLVACSLTLFVPGLVKSGSYAHDPTET